MAKVEVDFGDVEPVSHAPMTPEEGREVALIAAHIGALRRRLKVLEAERPGLALRPVKRCLDAAKELAEARETWWLGSKENGQ